MESRREERDRDRERDLEREKVRDSIALACGEIDRLPRPMLWLLLFDLFDLLPFFALVVLTSIPDVCIGNGRRVVLLLPSMLFKELEAVDDVVEEDDDPGLDLDLDLDFDDCDFADLVLDDLNADVEEEDIKDLSILL